MNPCLPVVPLPFTATVDSWADTIRLIARGFFELHAAHDQLETMLFLLVPIENTPMAGVPDIVVNDDNETLLVLHLPFTNPDEKAAMLAAARDAALHLKAKATAMVSEATIRTIGLPSAGDPLAHLLVRGDDDANDIVILHSETPGRDAQTDVATIRGDLMSAMLGVDHRALEPWTTLNGAGIRVEGQMTGFLPASAKGAAVTPPPPRRHSKGPAVTPTGAFTYATRRGQGPSA